MPSQKAIQYRTRFLVQEDWSVAAGKRHTHTHTKKKPLMPAFAGGLFRNRPLARKPATTAERRRSAGYERGSKMDAAAAIAERRPPPRRKPNVTPFLEKRAAPNMECGSGAKPVWRARGPSRTALCSPPSPFTRDSGDAEHGRQCTSSVPDPVQRARTPLVTPTALAFWNTVIPRC